MGIFDFFKKNKNIENDNGLNETYYDNGQIKERYYTNNGEINGVSESWYSNGQKYKTGKFINGKFVEIEIETWFGDGKKWTQERITTKEVVLKSRYSVIPVKLYDFSDVLNDILTKEKESNKLYSQWGDICYWNLFGNSEWYFPTNIEEYSRDELMKSKGEKNLYKYPEEENGILINLILFSNSERIIIDYLKWGISGHKGHYIDLSNEEYTGRKWTKDGEEVLEIQIKEGIFLIKGWIDNKGKKEGILCDGDDLYLKIKLGIEILHTLNKTNYLKVEKKKEIIREYIKDRLNKSKDEENITPENQNHTEKEDNSKEEDMVEVYVSSIDNMSGYGECGVTIYLTKEEYKEIEEDISYYTDSPGGIIELIKKYSKEECVLVSRYQIFDKEDQIYYEIIETETVNSSKPYKELDKTYYKKGHVNHPDPVEYNEMDEKEIEEFNNEWDYMGDNRYYGNDVYTIENFDLELELKTGY
jgi:hypothetical protein